MSVPVMLPSVIAAKESHEGRDSRMQISDKLGKPLRKNSSILPKIK